MNSNTYILHFTYYKATDRIKTDGKLRENIELFEKNI